MNTLKRNAGLLLVSVVAASAVATGVVHAERGPGRETLRPVSDDTSVAATTDDSASRVDTKPEDDRQITPQTISESGTTSLTEESRRTERVGELRSQAEKRIAEDRKGKKATTAADRQKACQVRQAKINKKITNYGAQATRHLTRLNTTYDKLQAYQAEQKLTVADYDTLIATADTKKAAAAAAVGELKSVTGDIDCAATDPAAAVATVKTTVSSTRSALHEYRKSVKAVLVALMTAKGEDSDKPAGTETEKTPAQEAN